ncbi:Pfam:DUF124 [Seminavis robusta]|uniref:Pfam:DUF124 n=1 Tax=Seminavis robusta TaxID=568900 RepID=A0A9N8DH61_9STRA|nr:Pfam:DUF124 [Seminavis robusta]CAB9523262.1 Pfam:DUF124 [Seminavis robusta]|eukprot:Sro1395_g269110.1 Pfam:DUF124 (343) ;mRNA; f:25783-27129
MATASRLLRNPLASSLRSVAKRQSFPSFRHLSLLQSNGSISGSWHASEVSLPTKQVRCHSTTNQPVESRTSSDGVVGLPIDFDIAAKIEGNESQIATIALEPGQVLRAESGAMMYMTQGVQMNTTTGGGLSSGFQRMLTGQNMFISDYTYEGEPGTVGYVALGTDFPSKIVRLNIEEYGGKLVCQKGALLCASHTVDIQMEFSKNFSTGFFGGEGFVLQGLTGEGDAFLKAGGTLIRRDLDDGEQLRISSGCLVGFSQGVDYDVQMVQGFKNVFAGGEGLFMTTLTGPGTVWLQGQPPQRMVSEIARRVPSGGGLGLAVPIGGVGGGGGEGGGGEGESTGSS